MDDNFERQKELLETNKKNLEKKLQEALEKLETLKESDIDKKEKRIELQLKNIAIKKYALKKITDKLDFLRPKNEEDIQYRLNQYNNFPELIQTLIPDELNLYFHGTQIYTARDIIKSGELSSSVDRLGVETSWDAGGQVSVTTRKTIDITVQGYTGLTGEYNLPAGCIFVILPKDKADENSLITDNVNFKEEPDRLAGIISTPENMDNLRKWFEESGIETSKIYTFETFIEKFSKQKKSSYDKEKFLESLRVDVETQPNYQDNAKDNSEQTKSVEENTK